MMDLIWDGEKTFYGKRLVDVDIINCSVIVYSERFFESYYTFNSAIIFFELLYFKSEKSL